MNIIIKHIEIIKRVDQLIRLQATGSPECFSARLGVSKTKLYRIINIMRGLNAPIVYDFSLQSFVYTETVSFAFGFYAKEEDSEQINPFAR